MTQTVSSAGFTLSSPEIKADALMEQRFEYNGFGCSGENKSPALKWQGAPAGTKAFAVTVYDPDAPSGSGWWHWVVMDIPNTFNSILYATRQPTRPENLSANLINLLGDTSTHPLLLAAGQVTLVSLQPTPTTGRIYTDDLAPVEWVTNDMILSFILRGGVEDIQ